MSTQNAKKEKISARNFVTIEGYLKANELQKEVVTGNDGSARTVISGSITVAINENEDYRIRFYAGQYWPSGSENIDYGPIENFLPDKTTTIASLLQANPGATFEEVKRHATPTYVQARFGVYDRKDEAGNISTIINIEGRKPYARTPQSRNPFIPKAVFSIEGQVERKGPEIDKETKEESGRVKMTVALPDTYRETLIPIEIFCESDSAVQQSKLYNRGDYGRFDGTLHNVRIETVQKGAVTQFADGTQEKESRTITTFVNERKLEKVTYPYKSDDAKFIAPDVIKGYRANREAALEELQPTQRKSASTAPTPNFAIPEATTMAPSVKGFQL